MFPQKLCFILSLISIAVADVTFTSPAAGESIPGASLDIQWSDSGSPALASYTLFLCVGGNTPDTYLQLATLKDSGDPATGALTATIPLDQSGVATNAYFLKMIGAATGGTIISYSKRFSLASMTGTFPPAVQAALGKISGTDGPPNVNQVAQVAAGATQDTGAYGVAYTMQSGPTRFAPMASLPGTVITAKNASPLFPKSSYSVYVTFAGAPNAQTTQTMEPTFSFDSIENTVAAAPQPTDTAMQKFLNRWKD